MAVPAPPEPSRFFGPINAHYRHSTKGFRFQRTLLKKITDWNLNYTTTDPLTITATFSCDTITPMDAEFASFGNLQSKKNGSSVFTQKSRSINR